MHKRSLRLIKIVFGVLLMLSSSILFAQNKIAISRRAPISLDFQKVYRAGAKGQIMADDSQWLNYTVFVKPGDPKVSVSVNIDSGSIPQGLDMYVEAGAYRGFSRGKMGSPTGRIPLSHIPRVLIDNIHTSYTGSGRNEGHQLTFYFEINDYSKLEPGINSIYVQYTITQQ